MRKSGRTVTGFATLAAALLLSACGGERPQSAAREPAPQAAALQPNAYVWNLRAALNVAALSCRGRGRVTVAPGYRRILARHSALLDIAYREEQRRHGVRELDRRQTALYNRFANQRSPERFCRAAADVAQRAGSLSSQALIPAAPGMFRELQSNLR